MPGIVTIITVTYNRAHILPWSLDSVLGQDYPDLRLLIVDDASSDGTPSLLARYEQDPRVEVLRHDHNQGVTAARNTALAHLGDEVRYIAYNDSDDKLVPGAVSRAVTALESRHGRYSMLFAGAGDATTGKPQGSVRNTDGSLRRQGTVTYDDFLSGRLRGDSFQLVQRDLLEEMRHDPRADGGEGVLWARMLRLQPGLLIADELQLKDRSGSDRVTLYHYNRAAAEGRMWTLLHKFRHVGDDMRQLHPHQYDKLLQALSLQAAMAERGSLARAAARQALRTRFSLRAAGVMAVALLPAALARAVNRAVRQAVVLRRARILRS